MHAADEVFRLVGEGVLTVNINQKMPLAEVVEAHRQLEAGETTGSAVLIP